MLTTEKGGYLPAFIILEDAPDMDDRKTGTLDNPSVATVLEVVSSISQKVIAKKLGDNSTITGKSGARKVTIETASKGGNRGTGDKKKTKAVKSGAVMAKGRKLIKTTAISDDTHKRLNANQGREQGGL